MERRMKMEKKLPEIKQSGAQIVNAVKQTAAKKTGSVKKGNDLRNGK